MQIASQAYCDLPLNPLSRLTQPKVLDSQVFHIATWLILFCYRYSDLAFLLLLLGDKKKSRIFTFKKLDKPCGLQRAWGFSGDLKSIFFKFLFESVNWLVRPEQIVWKPNRHRVWFLRKSLKIQSKHRLKLMLHVRFSIWMNLKQCIKRLSITKIFCLKMMKGIKQLDFSSV